MSSGHSLGAAAVGSQSPGGGTTGRNRGALVAGGTAGPGGVPDRGGGRTERGSAGADHSHAPARLVAAAVKLCSIASEPIRIADTQRVFVELGVEIGVAQGPMARRALDSEITLPNLDDEG